MGNCSLQMNYSNDIRLRKRFAQEIPTRESHKRFSQRNRFLRIVLVLLFCAGEKQNVIEGKHQKQDHHLIVAIVSQEVRCQLGIIE